MVMVIGWLRCELQLSRAAARVDQSLYTSTFPALEEDSNGVKTSLMDM